MRTHKIKHTDAMLKCDYCHYKTNRNSDLKNHARRHNGNMLECDRCQYKTSYPSTMNRHKKQAHAEDKVAKKVAKKVGRKAKDVISELHSLIASNAVEGT